MPKPGWIKLYYSILENPMWEREKPFTEAQAWIDLLLLAAYEAHEVNGETWEPGTVHLSKGVLMERWGWTRWRYDKVIKSWKQQGMIDQPVEQPIKRPIESKPITVVKWGFFQGSRRKNQPVERPIFHPQQKNIYKNSAENGGKTAGSRARKKAAAAAVELVRNADGEWVAKPK